MLHRAAVLAPRSRLLSLRVSLSHSFTTTVPSSFQITSSESDKAGGGPGLLVSSLGNGMVELQLSSPPVNTFTLEMLNNFRRTIEDLEQNPKVKGLVLTSAVPNVFSAGLDLQELHQPTREEFTRFWGTFEMCWHSFYMSPLATVAAIDGACPGLGAVLALSTDYRVMVNNPKFRIGLNETQLAMNPPEWLRHLCIRTMGPRNAEFHLCAGTLATPEQALEIGSVDELVQESSDLMPAAMAKLQLLTSVPDLARAQCKQGFRKDIAALANHESSVEVMADSCLGAEFQTVVDGVVQKLNNKSKNKK